MPFFSVRNLKNSFDFMRTVLGENSCLKSHAMFYVDLIQVLVLFLFPLSLQKGRTAPKAQRARSARAAGEGKNEDLRLSST